MSSDDSDQNGEESGVESGETSDEGQQTQGQPRGGQAMTDDQPAGGGNQPPGEQPQGGPAGGQPQGGPTGGQPAAGAPPGGQHQGEPGPGHRGPAHGENVADIFSKPSTMAQIKTVILLYAATGLSVGLAGFIFTDTLSDGLLSEGFGTMAALGAVMIGGPLVAAPLSAPSVQTLKGREADQQILATVAFGVFVGNIILVVLGSFLAAAGAGANIDFGDVLIIGLVGSIGAAIAALAAGYALLNFDGSQPPAQPGPR